MYFLEHQNQNPEFLNNYLKYYCFIQFASENTVNEAYFDLRTFFRYIKMKKSDEYIEDIEEFKKISIKDIELADMNDITQNTIDDFIFFLRYTLNNCPKTRNRKLATLKKFFEYLSINNHISFNPTRNTRTAKVDKRIPKHLNLAESKKLLSQTIQANSKHTQRNYTITCLFLNCGIRLSELVQIDLTDIKLDDMTLKIKGKGNKERIIYLNDATKEAIEEYIKVRPNLPKSNPDFKALFISERKKRISKRSVQNIIEQELAKLLEDNKAGFHTHSLRHTSATLLYNENEVDIRVIEQILGHSSLAATEIYTHISSKKMKEFMENCTLSGIIERERLKNEK